MSKKPLILGIESSCDETAASIITENEKGVPTILSNIISSQIDVHKEFGGVVPELAARTHIEKIDLITKKAIDKSGIKIEDINAVAATAGPGLIVCLSVGLSFGKAIAYSINKPFIAVNHLEGHALSPKLNTKLDYPYLLLLISGGHTQFLSVNKLGEYKRLGTTIDDAVGEAFDKVAKILGLPYPGGHEIEKQAMNGDENSFKLPQPLVKKDNLNFSFSGLKTSINLISKKNIIDDNFIKNVSASFQKCVSNILITKLSKAIDSINSDQNISISVVGGVANNNYLKNCFKKFEEKNNILFVYPPQNMMSDNAAMIAWATIFKYSKFNDINFKANPRLQIN